MVEEFSVGKKLAKARRELGKSVLEVSKELNIRSDYLRSMEKDDYEQLPGKVYISGFIKSYAEYLGLEYEPLVKMIKATRDLQEDYQNMPKEIYNDNKRHKKIFIAATGVLIILAMSLSYYDFIKYQINLRKIETKGSSSDTLAEFFNETQSNTEPEYVLDEFEKELLTQNENDGDDIIKSIKQDIIKKEKSAHKQENHEPHTWAKVDTSNVKLHSQKSKPPFARILLKANDDVWFQIRPLGKSKIYVSKVIPKNHYYWVTPWSDVVLDVSEPNSMEIIVDNNFYGIVGLEGKKVRGLPLDPEKLENYFIAEENKNLNPVENY